MSASRKSADERSLERSQREDSAWDQFEPKLAALQSFGEARVLVSRAPAEGTPGRGLYSNLGFFLQEFSVPGNASKAELHLYIGFIRRISGEIIPGRVDQIIQNLEQASRDRWW
jgi:hypothetical protein